MAPRISQYPRGNWFLPTTGTTGQQFGDEHCSYAQLQGIHQPSPVKVCKSKSFLTLGRRGSKITSPWPSHSFLAVPEQRLAGSCLFVCLFSCSCAASPDERVMDPCGPPCYGCLVVRVTPPKKQVRKVNKQKRSGKETKNYLDKHKQAREDRERTSERLSKVRPSWGW